MVSTFIVGNRNDEAEIQHKNVAGVFDVTLISSTSEFSPRVLERERQKVDFLADGDPIETDPVSHTVVPDSSAKYSGD